MLKPIEKQRVAQEIIDQLRTLILTGKYPVGSKLPPERELAKTLGVNRATLREALKKLEHLGLVRIRQGDGTRVLDFMTSGTAELIPHLLPLAGSAQGMLLGDVLEFRWMFGCEAARLAAQRADSEDLAALREIRDRGTTATGSELIDADFAFYVQMTAATKNRVMSLLVNTVRNSIGAHSAMLTNLLGSPEEVRTHHDKLIEAIEGRDPALAAAIASEHLVASARNVLRRLGITHPAFSA